MIVAITSRDSLDKTLVEGEDVLDIVSQINTAAANGRVMGIFKKDDGEPVALFLSNIIRLEGEDSAFIG